MAMELFNSNGEWVSLYRSVSRLHRGVATVDNVYRPLNV